MAALDRGELRLAQELQHAGLSAPASVLAIVMATRAHARPEAELVEIIRQYQGLETVADARLAVQELLRQGWLVQTESYNATLTHQAPNLRELIAEELKDPAIAQRLLALRANLEPNVRVLGAMNDAFVYQSFMELLSSAQEEIRLPMLATKPYDETVRILRERADAGVHVKILLGVPALVAKWRGEPMRPIAAQRIEEWVHNFEDRKTVEIRLSRTEEDMELATCVYVDGNVVRFDIYDPRTQRSLEGVMIEVVSPQGIIPNLVSIFKRLFDDAWSRAIGVRRAATLVILLRRWWKLLIALAILALAFLPVSIPHWSEVLIGLSCGIVTPIFIEGVPKLYRVVKRWQTF